MIVKPINKLIKCCPLKVIGDPDIIPLSFKKAMIEPENVIAPIAAPKDISIKLASFIFPILPRLNASGFKNVKVDKVYTLISTNDNAEKDGGLLFNIGLAGRLLAEENLPEEELSDIKNKIIEMSQNRRIGGKIKYKACLNFVTATK